MWITLEEAHGTPNPWEVFGGGPDDTELFDMVEGQPAAESRTP